MRKLAGTLNTNTFYDQSGTGTLLVLRSESDRAGLLWSVYPIPQGATGTMTMTPLDYLTWHGTLVSFHSTLPFYCTSRNSKFEQTHLRPIYSFTSCSPNPMIRGNNKQGESYVDTIIFRATPDSTEGTNHKPSSASLFSFLFEWRGNVTDSDSDSS